VLARIPTPHSARALYESLKRQRILVRHFDAPGLNDCLRISVGTDDEVGALLAKLQDLMGAR
jgi:histidinol-phosphate aminotransferase